MIEGTNVRDGARRRINRLGRRIGEFNRPRAASVVPLRGVACDGRGGGTRGACEAADPIEKAELPWKSCLDEPLSGMIDNRLRPSPSIADEKVISVVPSRYHLGGIVAGPVQIEVQGKEKIKRAQADPRIVRIVIIIVGPAYWRHCTFLNGSLTAAGCKG